MSHITYLAEPKDGEKILEVLESSPAKGSIELLYTRRPDAYESYKKESNNSNVLVVKEDNEIIGTAAEIIRSAYIGGEKKTLGYVCGIKKNGNYQGNVNWGKVIIRNLVKDDIDCYFCSILDDNKSVQTMVEKKRRKTVNMNYIQGYTTYMLTPYFKFKVKDNGYEFRQADKNDEQDIINFLNSEGSKKEFFPVFEKINQFTNLNVEDFYILKNKGEIIATAALWNQVEYRQYIVKRYSGVMKFAKYLNPILKMLGYIKLPKENEVINFPMLSFFITKDDNEEYYKAFLNNMNEIIKKSYGMFVIGTTKCSFANDIYKKLRSIHFDTRIYTIEFIIGNGKKHEIDKDKLWLECGLL